MGQDDMTSEQRTRPRRVAKRAGPASTEDATLAAIRQIVAQEATAVEAAPPPPEARRAALYLVEPAPPAEGRAPQAEPRRPKGFRMFRRQMHRSPPATAPAASRSVTARVGAFVLRMVWRFLRRPDAPRLIAISTLAFLVFTWPGYVTGLIVTAILFLMGLYLAIGYDRLAEMVYRRYLTIKAREPERAERMRLRAVAVSRWLTRATARLPASWTQGLYLPEFEEPQPPTGKMLADPYDRLHFRAGFATENER